MATNLDEDEPWWALLGHPLTRASEDGGALLLQFRPDAESPKILRLAAEGRTIRVQTIV